MGQNEFTTNFLLRQFGGHFENVRILLRHVMLRHRCGRQICFCMLLIRGKHAKRLFINENDKERKTLCCLMISKIKKVVLQCLDMKGNKLKKSKSCVVKRNKSVRLIGLLRSANVHSFIIRCILSCTIS